MKGETIFADTNLFLRFLTNDVPEQADAVERLLRRAAAGELRLVTSALVVSEIVWTLESFYGLPKKAVREHVLAILNTPGLEVAEADTLLQATIWYEEKNVDFVDAFNAAWLLDGGLERIATFDRRHFARFKGISVLVPG
ncbi:MAG: PIN domain-containing protein [Anaerolineae bacterium]|nr:PIN domain-containing protein [Anaerolineae bacterium]